MDVIDALNNRFSIREALEIPPELMILFAIALGYQDEKNAVNRFRSARRPVDEVVRFKGL